MSTKTKNQEARGAGLLQTWIQKLGGRDALSEEERQAYAEYNDILSRELTIDDVNEFLTNEIYTLNIALRKAVEEGKDREALYISARIENYQVWADYMGAPEREKDALIEHITSSINEA